MVVDEIFFILVVMARGARKWCCKADAADRERPMKNATFICAFVVFVRSDDDDVDASLCCGVASMMGDGPAG